jgi:hypothetical protein
MELVLDPQNTLSNTHSCFTSNPLGLFLFQFIPAEAEPQFGLLFRFTDPFFALCPFIDGCCFKVDDDPDS